MSKRTALVAAAAAVTIGAAGCGASSSSTSTGSGSGSGGQKSQAPSPNAPEVNPAGDIPDNQAYVPYAPPGGSYTLKVPEGWSRSSSGGATVFTDKLNTVRVESARAGAPPTVRDARQTEVPRLAASVKGFKAGTVSAVSRNAGTAVRITYLAKARPNAVTGKAGTDAVERYTFFHNGRDVILTLSGPKDADNVDPWKLITDSVTWR
jgi:hypothetical protein